MATTKTKQAKVTEEIKEESAPTLESTGITADDIVKSILNNKQEQTSQRSEYILCSSVTEGALNIICPSGNVYKFHNYGSDCEIERHDLFSLVRKHSDHIFNPRIVIRNDDFLEEFPQVKKVYENLYTNEELDEILSLPVAQLKVEIGKLPQNVFENLRTKIATKIADGSIDSVKTIRALSEIYDSDFDLLSKLFVR